MEPVTPKSAGVSLSDLRDVHLPPVPDGASFLPVVAAVVLVLVLALAGAALVARRRNGWAGEAERMLDGLAAAPPDAALAGAAGLLRRIALARIGPDAAKLGGDAWLEELDRLFGGDFFRHGAGTVFGGALYRADSAPDTSAKALAGLRRLLRRRRLKPW